ncbi:MFS transporter [Helicobacter saguini]|uniref:MFS transporter n=2 Tax=Helicobacter saguini TaxID=1548018 RepID=A0A347VMI5_9HELI|nr:MFS transporter [Helicobacter saguini]MWV68358.1 MFS transporter [Helicobacter saguini]MWV70177.1 MFS transporter [Helicobacter saguini]MWV72080.1 MFS transporter [Helicobacter saguini]TLD93773.1 MFS transporter [Helicobacter saguini]
MNALFIGMSFLFIGNSLIVSSVGVILKNSQMSDTAIGLISSCFFIGALAATISGHRIISRVGHIRSFGIFAALFAISSLFHAFSDNLYLWSIYRLMLGFCYYGVLMVIESWLNEKAKNEVRSRVLGFYEVVYYIASGLGVLIIALNLSKDDLFILSACLIMFSTIPLYLIRIKEPLLPKKEPISLPKIFDIAPLALVTAFIAGMLVNGFFAMASVFMLKQGFDVRAVSYFIASAMCGGFLAQSVIGIVSDKLGRKFAIMLCSGVAFAVMTCFLFFNLPLILQCALAVPLGGGVFCLYALSLARANDMAAESGSKYKGKSVELGRGILFCYSFGSLFAPVILGVLMEYFDTQGFCYFYLASLGFCLIFAINKPNVLGKSKKTPRNPGSTVMMQ